MLKSYKRENLSCPEDTNTFNECIVEGNVPGILQQRSVIQWELKDRNRQAQKSLKLKGK